MQFGVALTHVPGGQRDRPEEEHACGEERHLPRSPFTRPPLAFFDCPSRSPTAIVRGATQPYGWISGHRMSMIRPAATTTRWPRASADIGA